MAVGALDPQFYAAFLDGLGAVTDTSNWPDRHDVAQWPRLRARIASVLLLRTRDEWAEHFAETDACVTPVLGLSEAAAPPHLRHRDAYSPWAAGGLQPSAAPRFSRTPAHVAPSPDATAPSERWGLTADGVVAADRPD